MGQKVELIQRGATVVFTFVSRFPVDLLMAKNIKSYRALWLDDKAHAYRARQLALQERNDLKTSISLGFRACCP